MSDTEKQRKLCDLLLAEINSSVVISGAALVDMIHDEHTVATYSYIDIEHALFSLVGQKKVALFKVNPATKAIHWMHDLYAPNGTHIHGVVPGSTSGEQQVPTDKMDAVTQLAGELLLIHRRANTGHVIQISRDTIARLKKEAGVRTITPSLRREINAQLMEHGRNLVLHSDADGCYYLGTSRAVNNLTPCTAVERV